MGEKVAVYSKHHNFSNGLYHLLSLVRALLQGHSSVKGHKLLACTGTASQKKKKKEVGDTLKS